MSNGPPLWDVRACSDARLPLFIAVFTGSCPRPVEVLPPVLARVLAHFLQQLGRSRTLVVVLILKLVVLLAIRFSPLLAVLSLEHFLPIGGCCGGTH